MDDSRMEGQAQGPGMSMLALIDLPSPQGDIMRLLLRHGEMTYLELAEALALAPLDPAHRLELDTALAALGEQGYVTQDGEGDATTYRPNLRRRGGRNLTAVDLHLRAGGRLPLGLWTALDAGESAEPPRVAALAPPATEKPRRFQTPAWLGVVPLLWLIGTNALVLGLVDVVATSGFVDQVGIRQLPWLWIANMLIILLSSAAYTLVVDRMPRVRLMAGLLVGFAALFGGVVALFLLGAPSGLTYLLLYLIAEQQDVLFPLAFWALAGDLYSTVEAKKVFPMLAAGETSGMILGYVLIAGLSALGPEQAESAPLLLGLGAALYLLGLGVLWATFRHRVVHTRQASQADVGLRETMAVGYEVTRKIPLFRYLALSIGLVWLAAMPLEYHFLSSMDELSSQGGSQFKTLYGLYNIVVIVVTLALQSLVAARLLTRVPLRTAPLGLPLVLLVGLGCALLAPGFAGAVTAYFIVWLVYDVWDEPVRHALEGLIPDERRGRVLAFIESYTYAVGCILGSLLLGLLIVIAAQTALPDPVMRLAALLAAAVAAAGAVWSALRLRARYEDSLFDWRLAKARRQSVLEGIEF